MDKNTLTGFVLIALVMIGFGWLSQPSEQEMAEMVKQDSIAQVTKKQDELKKEAEVKAQKLKEEQVKADSTALFFNALRGKAENVVLSNNSVALTLSTKGGVVTKAVVKGFQNKKGTKDITLFDESTQSLNYILAGKDCNISTSDLYFRPENVTDSTVTMVADAGNGKSLEMKYVLGKDYLLSFSMKANGLNGMFAPNYDNVDIDWSDKVFQQEKGFMFENRYATLTYKEKEEGTDYLSETVEEKDEKIEEPMDWVAFKNQFFSAVMISKDDFHKDASLTSIPQQKGSGFLKQYNAKMKTFFDPTGRKATELEFYYGPNDFRLLQDVENESKFGKDLELERLVYLGWPLFRIINRWFTLYVFDWFSGFGIPMGIVLILVTLLLKVITYPFVKKSYMSSAKMRVLKPKLDELTKQYNKPEDNMQKQQAMMQLYAQYGVSPLGGCLPILIQMPIWIAMFNFVPNAIQLRGESFLWIEDLSTYDPIIEWGTNIWLIGDHLSLTCILFCVANLLYSLMMMRQQRDQMVGQQAQQMKIMQWMMLGMPIMFFFMFNDYSAGLNFYYFISLFCSATIMFVLRKTTNDEKLLAILEARYQENKKNPKKMSGLAARLEAMQKQQEEMRRKQEELRNRRR